MLGYYLDHSNTKPGWRKLTVKVKRDHVELRARTGFFVTHATVNPAVSRDSSMVSALQSPLDYTALQFVGHWDAVQIKDAGVKRVKYVVNLAPDPSLIDVTDKNHVALEFVAEAKTPEGKPVGQPVGQKMDLHLTADQLTTVQKVGIGYRGALDLAAGEYTVRIVIRDTLSGRIGSVAAPLKVE